MGINDKSKRLYASLTLAVSMMFGLVGTSGAATCAVSDVTIDGMDATYCGTGASNNTMTGGLPAAWSVNQDGAGDVSPNDYFWSYFEKEEEGLLGNAHDGNTSAISLSVSPDIADGVTSGTFTLNAFDPILITLKAGNDNYNWYLFEGMTGASTGTFDATAFGADLSNLSAYTTVVPVPAAVWLFATVLLGLVGVAIKRS